MKIEVTQQDIHLGHVGDNQYCAIARAVNRVLAEGYYVFVGYKITSIKALNGSHPYLTPTPTDAVNFIDAFDKRESVQPFTFYLHIPERFLC